MRSWADDGTLTHPKHVRARAFEALAWDEDLVAGALDRARAALEASTDTPTIEWACDVVRLHGTPDDAVRLVAALQRLRATDTRAAQAIERALTAFPNATTIPTDDATRLLVELQGWGQASGPPPPGWEDVVLRGLRSGDPHAISMALGRCPPSPSPKLLEAVRQHLGAGDQMAVACVRRHPDPAYVEPLLALLDSGEDDGLAAFASTFEAAKQLVPRDELFERVVSRLGTGGSDEARMMALVHEGLSARGSSQMGVVDPGEVPALKAAWTAFIEAHRAEIRRATPVPIQDTDPALLPRSFVFQPPR